MARSAGRFGPGSVSAAFLLCIAGLLLQEYTTESYHNEGGIPSMVGRREPCSSCPHRLPERPFGPSAAFDRGPLLLALWAAHRETPAVTADSAPRSRSNWRAPARFGEATPANFGVGAAPATPSEGARGSQPVSSMPHGRIRQGGAARCNNPALHWRETTQFWSQRCP